jgi:hypothetical protein
MKTMLKRFLTGWVLGLIVLAVPAFGTVYDYTTSGMNGSDWAGISNGNWLGWATVTPSELSVENILVYTSLFYGNTS